ncbi:MAG: undecaprenyldiphospho-muramoylpentapeptide beta-N-acetylglucosaminyltransferase [Actinomycetota bacterium]
MKIALAGGGTAGHIEPALNTADGLRAADPDCELVILGTARGLETTLVPARGYELSLIPAVPLPRSLNRDLLTLPVRLIRALGQTRNAIKGADVLVGFGGYVALPAYLAAKSLKIPIVVHEANAKAGLANKVGARLAAAVIETVAGSLPGAKRLGLPLRTSITNLNRAESRFVASEYWNLNPIRPTLLVYGGSQGARNLNRVVSEAAPELVELGWQILHSVGKANQDYLNSENPNYKTVEYIDRMDLAYAIADAAVTRAGAMTVAELTAVGIPSIYVPLPIGNGEQRLNALPVVKAGGGEIIPDAELSATELVSTLIRWESEGLANRAEAARSMGNKNSVADIVQVIIEVGQKR